MLYVIAGLVLIVSYFSVYHPSVLSKNISSLSESKIRHTLFLVLCLGSFFWIWSSGATKPNEWIVLGIELLLIQLAVIDAYSKIIPNRLVLLLLILAVVQLLIQPDFNQIGSIGLLCLGILVVQFSGKYLFSKDLFGWGDIKLFLVLALLYGMKFLEILLLSVVAAGLFSGFLLLLNRDYKDKKIPLAPFFTLTILLLSKNPGWSVGETFNIL